MRSTLGPLRARVLARAVIPHADGANRKWHCDTCLARRDDF